MVESPYRLRSIPGDPYRLVGDTMPRQGPAPVPLAHLPFAEEVAKAAKGSGLDPALVHALIAVESGHRQDAVSPKGAKGLMQLMPETARRYGVSRPERSPAENLGAGTRYLRELLNMFDNRLDLALAAYNAGEGAVIRYGWRIPPYRETQGYVPSVIEKYENWRVPAPPESRLTTYLSGTRLEPGATPRRQEAEQ